MPLQYKIPGYLGNALLLLTGLILLPSDNAVIGVLLSALSALNLYLVYKLDWFTRPEISLDRDRETAKMRDALLAAQKRVAELEAKQAG